MKYKILELLDIEIEHLNILRDYIVSNEPIPDYVKEMIRTFMLKELSLGHGVDILEDIEKLMDI